MASQRLGYLREAGASLKELRLLRNMTLDDVAAAMADRFGKRNGVSRATISRLENGTISRPDIYVLCSLGVLYGLTAQQIVELYHAPCVDRRSA